MARTLQLTAFVLSLMLLSGWQAQVNAQSPTALQITVRAQQADPFTFELADLDALPQHSFTTSTIWTDEAATFSGVPLKKLLETVGAEGDEVEMIALNDYKVTMSLAEVGETVPLVATRMDGQPMSVRDKGPYWLIFPYDEDPKYQTETIYSLSIWQLSRLNVVD